MIILFLAACIFISACTGAGADRISNLVAGRTADNNALMARIEFDCTGPGKAWVEYWPEGHEENLQRSAVLSIGRPVKDQRDRRRVILTRLRAHTWYGYRVVTENGGEQERSGASSFETPDMPDQLMDLYKTGQESGRPLSPVFEKGEMLIYKRETPGLLSLAGSRGELHWYRQLQSTGVKVAHFTSRRTLLCILATMDYPTSYGNELLELSLTGDTIFHLKKGQGDFGETVHHEILLNAKNQYVMLSCRDSVFDLSGVGGKMRDTIRGDGILVLDSSGRKLWGWSVFDVLNPLGQKDIAARAKDWMHANSLYIDKDGNYLISFYNNGQVWKLDGVTGKVLWKFGRDGDFDIPDSAHFDQGHAVHIDGRGRLLLFDNGVSQGRSRVLEFELDQRAKKASVALSIRFPQGVLTDRMGSAYLVGDSMVLTCVSKQHSVFLHSINGEELWRMTCPDVPYRVEFLPEGDPR